MDFCSISTFGFTPTKQHQDRYLPIFAFIAARRRSKRPAPSTHIIGALHTFEGSLADVRSRPFVVLRTPARSRGTIHSARCSLNVHVCDFLGDHPRVAGAFSRFVPGLGIPPLPPLPSAVVTCSAVRSYGMSRRTLCSLPQLGSQGAPAGVLRH